MVAMEKPLVAMEISSCYGKLLVAMEIHGCYGKSLEVMDSYEVL
jgi:hypothetical protein